MDAPAHHTGEAQDRGRAVTRRYGIVAAVLLAAWAAGQPAAAGLTFERTIQAPTPLPNERFGSVVVRFGTSNTVLVGADDHLFHPSNVYRVNALNAAQVALFHSPSNWDSDRFGAAIAADGASVFVGNPGWSNDKGAVYQYSSAGLVTAVLTVTDVNSASFQASRLLLGSAGTRLANLIVGAVWCHSYHRWCAAVVHRDLRAT